MSLTWIPVNRNGAGKSSLLQIMAGLDDGFSGEARLTPGFTVGYLAQEPQLDPSKAEIISDLADMDAGEQERRPKVEPVPQRPRRDPAHVQTSSSDDILRR